MLGLGFLSRSHIDDGDGAITGVFGGYLYFNLSFSHGCKRGTHPGHPRPRHRRADDGLDPTHRRTRRQTATRTLPSARWVFCALPPSGTVRSVDRPRADRPRSEHRAEVVGVSARPAPYNAATTTMLKIRITLYQPAEARTAHRHTAWTRCWTNLRRWAPDGAARTAGTRRGIDGGPGRPGAGALSGLGTIETAQPAAALVGARPDRSRHARS